MFDHAGGFKPILRRMPGTLCLHVLLRETGFGHPSGKLVAAQPIHRSMGQLSGALFGRNQQTRALKSLKANCTWKILAEIMAKS